MPWHPQDQRRTCHHTRHLRISTGPPANSSYQSGVDVQGRTEESKVKTGQQAATNQPRTCIYASKCSTRTPRTNVSWKTAPLSSESFHSFRPSSRKSIALRNSISEARKSRLRPPVMTAVIIQELRVTKIRCKSTSILSTPSQVLVSHRTVVEIAGLVPVQPSAARRFFASRSTVSGPAFGQPLLCSISIVTVSI